jgi:hypothetical protein
MIGRPFKKGESGNPGGRPKVVAEVKELARRHTTDAIQTLVSIMKDPSSAPAARVSAANALLDRGYGKPPQHVTGESVGYFAVLPQICESEGEWAAKFTPPKDIKRLVSEPESLEGTVARVPNCGANPGRTT